MREHPLLESKERSVQLDKANYIGVGISGTGNIGYCSYGTWRLRGI